MSDDLPACEPTREFASDECEYPESLGGSGDATDCGATPAAWYPLGDSELTSWPERALWRSASGGGVGRAPWYDTQPHVAFDAEGGPVVAWVNEGLEVRRWQDDAWETLPPIAPELPQDRRFELILDRAGNPVVFEQYQASAQVLRWAHEGWVSLDEWSVDDRVRERMRGQITLDAQDDPIVVYNDRGRIFARRWDGSSFQELPGAGADGSLSNSADPDVAPALALRQNGDIVVAWVEALDYPAHAVWLLQFDGEGWQELGESANGAGVAPVTFDSVDHGATVAVDDDDQVIVAGGDWPADAWVRAWDGAAWSAAAPGLERPQLIESPGGRVYLAGSDANFVLSRPAQRQPVLARLDRRGLGRTR